MTLKNLIKEIIPSGLLNKYNLLISRKRYKRIIHSTLLHYKDVEQRIKQHNEIPLRFAAYVVYDSTFAAYGLMDLMLKKTDKYSAKIVICPDVARGEANLKEQYKKTKKFFVKKYGEDVVLDGYDENTGIFMDYSDNFDIVYCANPYDSMVNKYHSIKYLSTRDLLPIYINYGCLVDAYSYKYVMPLLEMSLFWKVFADEIYSYRDFKRYELCKGKNVVITGYAKMDSLESFSYKDSSRKRIIIAPHHTINTDVLPLSNFLELSDFILELPKLYPNIDFIFRPHPLLFVNMVNEGFWNQKEVEAYINKIESAGMIYSFGGDYLDIFVNSDAIIHDCASFIMEYLYTGKPCCFVAKKNSKIIFSTLGKKCLKNYYTAYNKKEIIRFIDNVVIDGVDPLQKNRIDFFGKIIGFNYPNVSEKILEKITL